MFPRLTLALAAAALLAAGCSDDDFGQDSTGDMSVTASVPDMAVPPAATPDFGGSDLGAGQ